MAQVGQAAPAHKHIGANYLRVQLIHHLAISKFLRGQRSPLSGTLSTLSSNFQLRQIFIFFHFLLSFSFFFFVIVVVIRFFVSFVEYFNPCN
jgi:hypothetical protein